MSRRQPRRPPLLFPNTASGVPSAKTPSSPPGRRVSPVVGPPSARHVRSFRQRCPRLLNQQSGGRSSTASIKDERTELVFKTQSSRLDGGRVEDAGVGAAPPSWPSPLTPGCRRRRRCLAHPRSRLSVQAVFSWGDYSPNLYLDNKKSGAFAVREGKQSVLFRRERRPPSFGCVGDL